MELSCFESLDMAEMEDSPRKAFYDKAIFTDPRVLSNLLFLEDSYTPRNYFSNGDNLIEPYMRKIVTTWMLEVCEDHHCEEQVFPLAINFLDRFLAACPIKPNQLQLSATVSLLLSSKVRMCEPLTVHMLSRYADRSVTEGQIKDWEVLVLSKLQWEVCGITGFDFIDHLLEGSCEPKIVRMLRSHALTLLALAYTESELVSVRASVLGSAAIVSAARGLKIRPDVLGCVCKLTKSNPSMVESIVLRIEVILADCAAHQSYSQSDSRYL